MNLYLKIVLILFPLITIFFMMRTIAKKSLPFKNFLGLFFALTILFFCSLFIDKVMDIIAFANIGSPTHLIFFITILLLAFLIIRLQINHLQETKKIDSLNKKVMLLEKQINDKKGNK